MSSEIACSLYEKLLVLAENLLNALQEERFDEALEYIEKRQMIIDEIQSLNSEIINHGPINLTIKNILAVDGDIQDIIKTNLNALSDNLCSVSKMKLFINNINYNQTGVNFNLNI